MKNLTGVLALLLLSLVACQAQQNPSSSNIIIVGNKAQPVQFAHQSPIQTAVNDAGASGLVIIPADYPFPSETFTNPNNINVWDLRGNQFKVSTPLVSSFINATSGYLVNNVALASTNLSDSASLCYASVLSCNFSAAPNFGTSGWIWNGTASGQQAWIPNATIGGTILGPPVTAGTDTLTTLGLAQLFTNTNGFKRLTVSPATTVVAGDFTLSGTWGTTAAVSKTVTTSKDQAFVVTVTSTGTGQGANPTVTITFHDGTFTNVPACTIDQSGGTGTFQVVTVTSRSATAYTWQWAGTPVAASTYEFTGICLGT